MKELRIGEFGENPFRLIGQDWMLITAGTLEKFNMMTASWGAMGHLWDRNICLCFVRPSRYTFKFMEKHRSFTLSFLPPEYRSALEFCGSYSGRDVNKVKKTGLTPVAGFLDDVYFVEARLVFECRKIAFADLDPKHFLDPAIHEFYEGPDHHRMYVGEIVRILAKEAPVL